MKKGKGVYDTETRRSVLHKNYETNQPWPDNLFKLQQEVLPTVQTEMITIEYYLEVAVYHKGVVGSWQEVPSLHFPILMARNIPKEVTYNVTYMRHSQENMKE